MRADAAVEADDVVGNVLRRLRTVGVASARCAPS